MVQYIFTPWRTRRELLAVRSQFYPEHQHQQVHNGDDANSKQKQEDKQKAVARVSMWMQRGGCPHMVESTALLTAAILSDDEGSAGGGGGGSGGFGYNGYGYGGEGRASSGYAVRAAYSAAFSRFVTGLLDSHQDKQRKMSMYDVAKSVGLPATFVELRHQATHEQLPSLTRLRAAARKALDWIWDYYWRHLAEVEAQAESAEASTPAPVEQRASKEEKDCRELIVRYLEDAEGDESLVEEIKGLNEGLVLATLDSISGSTRDSKVLRRSVALTREILERGRDQDRMDEDGIADEVRIPNDIERVRAELDKARKEMKEVEEAEARQNRQEQVEVEVDMSDDRPGWTLYEEDAWIPKPIGVV